MWKRKVSYVERWDFYARRCDMFLWKQEVVFLDHGAVMKKKGFHMGMDCIYVERQGACMKTWNLWGFFC